MSESKSAPPALFPLLFLAVTLIPSLSGASVSVALSIDDLARRSVAVARATPTAQSAHWENGRIVTTTHLRVDGVIAGSIAGSPAGELDVKTLGGVVGDIGQYVEGEARFAVDTPSIVFLTPRKDDADDAAFAVTGRAQGQLLIVKEVKDVKDIVRAAPGGKLVPKALRIPEAPMTGTPIAALDGKGAAEVTRALASAWEMTHAK